MRLDEARRWGLLDDLVAWPFNSFVQALEVLQVHEVGFDQIKRYFWYLGRRSVRDFLSLLWVTLNLQLVLRKLKICYLTL